MDYYPKPGYYPWLLLVDMQKETLLLCPSKGLLSSNTSHLGQEPGCSRRLPGPQGGIFLVDLTPQDEDWDFFL